MELFDQLMNPNWKNIPMEHKLVLASSIVRYFVNPLLPVADIRPAYYQMGGIKTETFTVEINDSPFVFVPGHKAGRPRLGQWNQRPGPIGYQLRQERDVPRYRKLPETICSRRLSFCMTIIG